MHDLKQLEKKLGYRFKKRRRLKAALTHRSYRFENEGIAVDNQRLEFLGDAVLGLVVAAYAFDRFEGEPEGVLTTFRSRTTSGRALAARARELDLGAHLAMGKGEEQSGGRKRSSNLADALEAVLGAAYLDGGQKAVEKIFRKIFLPALGMMDADSWADNPKGRLQELCQREWGKGPSYRLLGQDGPPHATVFSIAVALPNGVEGDGEGRSKQAAQTAAAVDAIRKVEKAGIACGDKTADE